MQIGETAVLDDLQRILEHPIGFGGKARNDVGAEYNTRTARPEIVAERDRVLTGMAALHPLENHVVARLQRQMNMRHQPLLTRDNIH